LSYKLEQRLAAMTPEERDKFKNRLHHGWHDFRTEGDAEEEK
jgi:hypothetical protein